MQVLFSCRFLLENLVSRQGKYVYLEAALSKCIIPHINENVNKKTHRYSQKRGKVVEDEMRNASLMVSKT